MQSRRRAGLRNSLMPRLFNKKMQNLSLGGVAGNVDPTYGDFSSMIMDPSNEIGVRERKNKGILFNFLKFRVVLISIFELTTFA